LEETLKLKGYRPLPTPMMPHQRLGWRRLSN